MEMRVTAAKEAYVRQDKHLEWEIPEVEGDEWAEVTMAAADERGSVRWRHLATALGTALLLIALMGAAGHRLWQEAEAGIAATEHHIGTLVEVKTLRKRASNHAVDNQTEVEKIILKSSMAMVSVAVTETSPTGQPLP